MHRIASFLSLMIILSACKNSRQDKDHLEIVLSGIEDATKVISYNTKSCLSEMEDRTKDPRTAEKAEFILPKMKSLHFSVEKSVNLIQVCIDKIESSTTPINDYIIDAGLTYELFDSLQKIKTEIISMDEGVVELFEKNAFKWALTFPGDRENRNTFSESNFENQSEEKLLLFLYTLKMDVKMIENKIMWYCINAYNSNIHGYSVTRFLIGMSTKKIRPAGQMEITAGLGYFESRKIWRLEVDGVNIPIKEDGYGIYQFKAESSPGKKKKTVKIYYRDQYGDNQIASNQIEYEVVK
jgi:hypothetical protein